MSDFFCIFVLEIKEIAMKFETKNYHIGIIFPDDTEKISTMMTCKRLGIRISSVYQALKAGKGVMIPYDQESYKLLWKPWTVLRLMKCPDKHVAQVRQECLNKIKRELEWLDFGSEPERLPFPISMLTNVEPTKEGFEYVGEAEKMARIERIMREIGENEDAFWQKIAEVKTAVGNHLFKTNESFRNYVENKMEKCKCDKNPENIKDFSSNYAYEYVCSPARLTLRARYDERPSYAKELDRGVRMEKSTYLSEEVRIMLGGITDVKPLTDETWRGNVVKVIETLMQLQKEVEAVEDGKKKATSYQLVEEFLEAVRTACTHARQGSEPEEEMPIGDGEDPRQMHFNFE